MAKRKLYDLAFTPMKISGDLKYWTDEMPKPTPEQVWPRVRIQHSASSGKDMPCHVNCRCSIMKED